MTLSRLPAVSVQRGRLRRRVRAVQRLGVRRTVRQRPRRQGRRTDGPLSMTDAGAPTPAPPGGPPGRGERSTGHRAGSRRRAPQREEKPAMSIEWRRDSPASSRPVGTCPGRQRPTVAPGIVEGVDLRTDGAATTPDWVHPELLFSAEHLHGDEQPVCSEGVDVAADHHGTDRHDAGSRGAHPIRCIAQPYTPRGPVCAGAPPRVGTDAFGRDPAGSGSRGLRRRRHGMTRGNTDADPDASSTRGRTTTWRRSPTCWPKTSSGTGPPAPGSVPRLRGRGVALAEAPQPRASTCRPSSRELSPDDPGHDRDANEYCW